MIVAGLLAALLTYSVLREASGTTTAILVAARAIRAGDTVQAPSFTHATVKGSAAGLGLLGPSDIASLSGEVATVGIAAGQAIERQDFQARTPAPPSMAIPIALQSIPGGVAGVPAGDLVDVLGTAANGTPQAVPGLRVVTAPQAPSSKDLAAGNDTVDIVVAVPTTATASSLSMVLTSGKYSIRVSPPGTQSGDQPGDQPGSP
ncbi:MAG TPA: hypothetical protein VFW71_10615 [Actinomycetota bacterium]|nr:hypothetical protein [Actinomycetota bacterium]